MVPLLGVDAHTEVHHNYVLAGVTFMTTISKIIESQTFRRSLAFIITIAVHLWVNRNKYRKAIESLFVYRYEPIVNVAPTINPLYTSMELLMNQTSKELRAFTGIKRKNSKMWIAGQYLCMV